MQVEEALARLDALQRPIRNALREALPLLGDHDASRFKALSLLRWQVLRLMDDYQRFKHERILDPAITRDDGTTDQAAAIKDRCLALAADLDAHVRRWSLEPPLGDWELYQDHARRLRQRIEADLDDERRLLPALVADPPAGPAGA